MSSNLADRRVLVVEDEYFVAQQIARAFRELGAQVLGPVPTSEAAIAIAREKQVDAAVLDIHLREGTAYPVADLLSRKGVPFLFATGYDPATIPEEYAQVRVYEKPLEPSVLAQTLMRDLRDNVQSVRTELSYSIRQDGGFWCWEIKRFGIVTEKGSASSNINARVAVFLAAMKRSN
jgi:CheY-like chemotaxis protein